MGNYVKSKSFALFAIVLGILTAAAVWMSNEEKRVASIDGVVITERQLDDSLARQLTPLYQQIYDLKRRRLDDLVDAQLLSEKAKQNGISVATLLEREVGSKTPAVSENDIQEFYAANGARLRVELDKVRDQIRDYLNEQRHSQRKKEFIQSLRADARITTYLERPPLQRANVSVGEAPYKGSDSALVTIVKFEDFECPFCKNVQSTLAAVLKKYNGRVRVVHKDLPLQDIHPQAQVAAESARCAGEQGKFWEYHDTLYAKAPKLAAADLKLYAKEMGLDSGKFDKCVTGGKYKSAVQNDLAEGAKLGLTGTPTFFINGREISGALPLESFAAIIDEELAQAK